MPGLVPPTDRFVRFEHSGLKDIPQGALGTVKVGTASGTSKGPGLPELTGCLPPPPPHAIMHGWSDAPISGEGLLKLDSTARRRARAGIAYCILDPGTPPKPGP
ncbi:hypothetical protein CDD83_7401 [Cordyceps sp. RAO-2017]|nr:hypothetical protein CDD83_7401 [Cordyceps sp. RAO-2017]